MVQQTREESESDQVLMKDEDEYYRNRQMYLRNLKRKHIKKRKTTIKSCPQLINQKRQETKERRDRGRGVNVEAKTK